MTPSGLSMGIILKTNISLNNRAVILLLNKKSTTPVTREERFFGSQFFG